jgi:hypothetical protein
MTCGPGKVKSGALCYPDPGPGWTVKAGIATKQGCPPGFKDDGELMCLPGGGGSTPWYLSFYMLMIACAIIALCVIYWRVRAVYSMVVGGRRRGIKTRN